ncbi:MAG TPA: DUF455 family protein [Acidimicrobiales bacterium]|nr:DUF455 family protein [Acidimicrobiales bacterium]
MRQIWPADRLARDGRFVEVDQRARFNDPRIGQQVNSGNYQAPGRMSPEDPTSPDRARALMHGIFMGEVQALEGAGRTCWDFDEAEAPYALKLDMARQCWDEARHVEISVKLSDWMGTEIGEFAESRFLYQAACSPDPVLRLTGVNRGLEGLAIDVFNTMRDFGERSGDPVLAFCEDWMLADEVTHVKMGSDWLRQLTANDPERRERALEFQRTIDKLFSFNGGRSNSEDSPIILSRRFRQLAGFSDDEIEEIGRLGDEARAEMIKRLRGTAEEPAGAGAGKGSGNGSGTG